MQSVTQHGSPSSCSNFRSCIRSLPSYAQGYCVLVSCCLALLLVACNQNDAASTAERLASNPTPTAQEIVRESVTPELIETPTRTTIDLHQETPAPEDESTAITAMIGDDDPVDPPISDEILPPVAPSGTATTTQSLTNDAREDLEPNADSNTETDEASLLSPTAAQIILVPTNTPVALILEPTNTPTSQPMVHAVNAINVRGGPGTNYPVIGALAAGAQAEIQGKNPTSDWWQVRLVSQTEGWVYATLVETTGNTADVAVAADIPPPPTATPAPVAAEQPVAVPSETESPQPTSAPVAGGPDFRVIEKRLWDVYENGGHLNGPTVTCGEKRQLVVNVVDINGSRINGVAVQAQYGAKEIFVTGAQGKGDGVVEYVLGRGQDVKVIRDVDGREVTSEMATGLSTEPAAIPYEQLIAGQYCSDDESCRLFVDAPGCWGHYSWTVTFQRTY